MNLNGLEKRVYKYKNKSHQFFCPLCRTERGIAISPRLSKFNYFQIFLTTLVIGFLLFPLIGFKSFFIFFVIWSFVEYFARSQFKEQVACPHCGFDATSYKRDVKVARQQVKDFWAQKSKT